MTVDFARRLRSRETITGYWSVSGNTVLIERIALAGYDYVCLDMQHGLADYASCLNGLIAVEAGGSAGVVRVPWNEDGWIYRALDAGAQGVIVPLVNSADEAARAARACRYPPAGTRSYGPTRSALRVGPEPRVADDAVACIVMIETAGGLKDLDAICQTPGVDAVYVGPSDLALALGASVPAQGPSLPEFTDALGLIRRAAEHAGIAAGLHCTDGPSAAAALDSGFTFVSISNELNHLHGYVRDQLDIARAGRGGPEGRR